MRIRYKGGKKTKTLEINSASRGTIRYVFDPVCEINELTDSELVAFCLSPDRGGLFEIESEKKKQPETENVGGHVQVDTPTGVEPPQQESYHLNGSHTTPTGVIPPQRESNRSETDLPKEEPKRRGRPRKVE